MTIPELECVVCASLLESPTERVGPNVAVALAYAPDYWDSPEASKVACGIQNAIRKGRPTHRVVVGLLMEHQYREWLKHPMFCDGLPMSCVEPEAKVLVEHYHKKRVVATIAKAYQELVSHPEKALVVGLDLKLQLEGLIA